jgi:hypothetical protein
MHDARTFLDASAIVADRGWFAGAALLSPPIEPKHDPVSIVQSGGRGVVANALSSLFTTHCIGVDASTREPQK